MYGESEHVTAKGAKCERQGRKVFSAVLASSALRSWRLFFRADQAIRLLKKPAFDQAKSSFITFRAGRVGMSGITDRHVIADVPSSPFQDSAQPRVREYPEISGIIIQFLLIK